MRKLVCLLVVAVALAASTREANAQCTSDAECRGGRVCIDGACSTPGCTTDVQCPADQICENGACVAAATTPPPPPPPPPQQQQPGAYPPPAGYQQPGAYPPPAGYQQPGAYPPPAGYQQPGAYPPPVYVAPTESPTPPSPRGPGFFLQLGLSVCVDGTDVDCPSSLDPSFGFAGGFFWRFLDYLGVDAQMFFGMADAQAVDLIYIAGLLVGPRLYVPIAGIVDLEAGLGFGYGRYESHATIYGTDTKAWAHGFNLGLKFGAEFRLSQVFSLGTLFQFVFPFFTELCTDPDLMSGNEACADYDADQNVVWMQWGVQATIYFSP